MKKIKPFIGYIPVLIVAVPCLVAYVRQSLYYKGCMDGFGFLITAMFAFIGGGILNLIFMSLAIFMIEKYLDGLDKTKKKIAMGAIYLSVLTLAIQLCVVFYLVSLKLKG